MHLPSIYPVHASPSSFMGLNVLCKDAPAIQACLQHVIRPMHNDVSAGQGIYPPPARGEHLGVFREVV